MAQPPVRPTKPKFQLAYLFSGKNRRATQTYNEDYAQYQWDQENYYNSPAQQMKRYKDANLNTNLMYGQGTPGNAGQMPNVEPYQNLPENDQVFNAINPLDKLSRFADIKMKMAHAKKISAETPVTITKGKREQGKYEAESVSPSSLSQDEIENLPPLQRKQWQEMQTSIHQTETAMQNAKNAKQQVELNKKLNILRQKEINWYISMAISGMFVGGAGAISRLK